MYVVARITRLEHREAVGRMSLLAHGGEFAFVLFSAATTAGVMSNHENATFTAAVIISMLFSPFITQITRKLAQCGERNQRIKPDTSDLSPIDDLEALTCLLLVLGV